MPFLPSSLAPKTFASRQKVLLASSNTVIDPYPVFPIGIAFLEAALQGAGHSVRLWDPLVHNSNALLEALDWADVVGVSLRNVDNVSSRNPMAFIEEHHRFLARIRAGLKAPVIAGGSAFSIFPGEMLDEFDLDWGIQGEAENALLAWLEALSGKLPFAAVPGLVYRVEGTAKLNPPAPIPARDIPVITPALEWIAAYVRQGGMLNVQTQRGCALHCTYCTYPWIEGTRYRRRNPEALVREIRHLQQAGVRYVFFADSVFNTSDQHVRSVCEAFIRANLDMEWGCFARPQNLRPDTLDLMVKAGLKHLEFGSDSFSDTTLQSYGKSFRFHHILEASRVAAERAVHTCHYIIFGGPGETPETVRETVRNSRLLPDAPIFAFSGMRIYPHTPLFHVSGSTRSVRELLMPHFFEDPAFSADARARVISEATAGMANWIASDHADDNTLTGALRRRGKQGPLWEYLGLSRRMGHQGKHSVKGIL